MKCPCCRDVDLVMSERSGVEIDYCPSCRGVWLDRGELDKIIERSSKFSNNGNEYDREIKRDHHYDNHDDHSFHGHKHKKSWLGDLFD